MAKDIDMEKEKCDESKPCDTCETGSTCSAKEKEDHEEARLAQNLFRIRNKIMVMSGKGGVGKSTVSQCQSGGLPCPAWLPSGHSGC